MNRGAITVFGGQQLRPNLHIDDMVALYVRALEWPDERIDGQIFNVGSQNYLVSEIADIVRRIVGSVSVDTTPTDDHRSYHISSEKIRRELGFEPVRSVEDAVHDLVAAFRQNLVPNPMTNPRYYNIKTMQAMALQ